MSNNLAIVVFFLIALAIITVVLVYVYMVDIMDYVDEEMKKGKEDITIL